MRCRCYSYYFKENCVMEAQLHHGHNMPQETHVHHAAVNVFIHFRHISVLMEPVSYNDSTEKILVTYDRCCWEKYKIL